MNIEPLGTLARTHTCGALRADDVGKDVVLLGWVHRVRDLGSLVFIDLRDRHGMTQIVARVDEQLIADAKRLRSEFVVGVIGSVEPRAPETVNPKIATGEVEVTAREFRLLNEARTPPFMIADEIEVTEETRLKHRYIDLRRPRMQRNMIMRHRAAMTVRQYLDEQGFLEIETPILAKSTPEGARDYLVPSRVHPGEFYALPQSPQIFKQILMIAGMDRLLPDRALFPRRGSQGGSPARVHAGRPRDVVCDGGPGVLHARTADGTPDGAHRPDGATPVSADALCRGDREVRVRQARPALRHARSRISRLRLPARHSRSFVTSSRRAERFAALPCPERRNIRAVSSTSSSPRRRGSVRTAWSGHAAATPACRARRSRRRAKRQSNSRSSWQARAPPISWSWPRGRTPRHRGCSGSCAFRSRRKRTCSIPDRFDFLWVVDFPMFEWVEDEGRYEFMHHPFTAPLESDRHLLESDQGRARARAYDLVLNGSEIGGGSIRIHDQARTAAHLQAPWHLGRGSAAALRVLRGCARVRDTAAWRDRARARPDRGDPVRGAVDSRRHCVSQDGAGGRPHGRRALDRQRQAAAGAQAQVGGPEAGSRTMVESA